LYILIQSVGHKPHFPRYSGTSLRDSLPCSRAVRLQTRTGAIVGQATSCRKLPWRNARRPRSWRRPDFH
jgi:hypothetical protein